MRRRIVTVIAPVAAAAALAVVGMRSLERTRFTPVTIASTGDALVPTHACVAARDVRIADVVFASTEGPEVLVYLEVGAVGVWPLLVRFWPELVLLMTAIVVPFVARRLSRRRPTANDPRCRRCDYRLVGCTSGQCPECGLELVPRNRVRRRSPRIARVACVAIPLLLVAGYAGFRDKVPRHGRATWWMHWPSTFAYDWLYRHGQKSLVDQYKVWSTRLVWLDPVTGRTRDLAQRETTGLVALMRLAAAPDGSMFALPDGSAILVVDARTLRITHRLSMPAPPGVVKSSLRYARVVFDADGAGVAAVRVDGAIDRWSLADATCTSINLSETLGLTKQQSMWVRGLALTPDAAVLAVGQYQRRGQPRMLLHRLTPDFLRVVGAPVELPGDVMGFALHPDTGRWFAVEAGLGRGRPVALLAGDVGASSWTSATLDGANGSAVAVSPDGDLVLAASFGSLASGALLGHAGLWDADALQLLDTLGADESAVLHASFSRDGRRLVTAGAIDRGQGRSPCVAVYDVSVRSP